MKKRQLNLKTKNFIGLTIAGIINGFGVSMFLYPVKIYDSGISGLSMFLDQITPSFLTISLFLLIFNLPIFLFGLKKHGIEFTIYSLYAVIIYSLVSFLLLNIININLENGSPLAGNELILCAIFGGFVSGIGSGLTIKFGGAIDGIDILSVTFAKKLSISVGSFNMIFNFILYCVCGIYWGQWVLPLYSIVTYFVGSKTIDFIVDGLNRSKFAMIVTDKADEILRLIKKNFESAGTIVDAKGGYSGEGKTIIYLVINHFQLNKLKDLVHSVDANAFISLQEVSEVVQRKK